MTEEGLRAWFGKSSEPRSWTQSVVQVGGKYDGKPCARQPGQKSFKCVLLKRRSMRIKREIVLQDEESSRS